MRQDSRREMNMGEGLRGGRRGLSCRLRKDGAPLPRGKEGIKKGFGKKEE